MGTLVPTFLTEDAPSCVVGCCCVCRCRAPPPFIIGGDDVDRAGKYPWQGSLQLLGSHSCGCSLVSSNYVITAAHCVLATALQSVVLGAHDIISQEQGRPVRYRIDEAKVHPDWDASGDGFPNDIALLRLEFGVEMSEFVGVVPLAPSSATEADYSNCIITGWGASRMIGGILPVMPDVLQEAAVGIYDKQTCENMFAAVGNAAINGGHICVGEEGLRGACSGDSGGPLVCTYNGEVTLVGLTSWGISTCSPDFPSVYTRISFFRQWVDDNMN